MLKRVLLALTLVGSLLLTGQGSANAIVNGEPDGNRHPYVGIVFTDEFYCSGTAISPTVVVTAAHCLELGDRVHVSFAEHPTLGPDHWPVPTGAGVIAGTMHRINDYCLPPGSCHPGAPGYKIQSDVAVVVLDSSASLSQYAALPDAGVVDTLPDKKPVAAVGYGVNSIIRGGGRPILGGDPERKMFTGQLLRSNFSGSDRYLRLRVTKTHAQTCFGDSGGPVLNGRTLLGVMSLVSSVVCTGPSSAARVDLQPILDAIRAYL